MTQFLQALRSDLGLLLDLIKQDVGMRCPSVDFCEELMENIERELEEEYGQTYEDEEESYYEE